MQDDLMSTHLILEDLESDIARYIGTRHAVLCSSGRMAIQVSLLALGIGHGDEVVVPDFACQILPIAVFCAGSIPKFCDIDKQTLALSSACLPRVLNENTKAVIFAHLFGFPADPSPILEITDKRGIIFIDDAAQALGASIKGKKAGSFGDLGILTFNKNLNVDFGAAVTTNNEELANKVRLIREKKENKSFFALLGYRIMELSGLKSRKLMKTVFRADKYLNKLQHATFTRKHFIEDNNGWLIANSDALKLWGSNTLTISVTNQLMSYGRTYSHSRKMEKTEISFLQQELRKSEKYLKVRKKLAETYDNFLESTILQRLVVPKDYAPSYLRYPVFFNDRIKLLKCLKELIRAGIKVDGLYKPLHMSPFFNPMNKDIDFEESISVSKHILPLPIKLNMTQKEVERIASIINCSFLK
jgi:dTDP-4-amino-4,6-dideoxygalactose transaminase